MDPHGGEGSAGLGQGLSMAGSGGQGSGEAVAGHGSRSAWVRLAGCIPGDREGGGRVPRAGREVDV